MEILAIIPARGGSKGVPRKNIRLVAGKPLIAYSIEHALHSNLITRVIVSTEDQEIADVSRQHGAEIPFRRPENLAGDKSIDLDVFKHALEWLEENESYSPDVIVQLRPTCPVRQVSTIDRAIQTFIDIRHADSLRSVHLAEQTPYKMWFIGDDGLMNPVITLGDDLESCNLSRQALPLVYWQNGYIDITRSQLILEQNSMSGTKILPFIIDEEIVDIDYEEALIKSESMLLDKGGSEKAVKSHVVKHPS